jgi:hypothetical protein
MGRRLLVCEVGKCPSNWKATGIQHFEQREAVLPPALISEIVC